MTLTENQKFLNDAWIALCFFVQGFIVALWIFG